MADYVAREWSGGDIVTAANLNNIEQGIAEASQGGGGTLRVNVDRVDTTSSVTYYDRTWQEVYDALERGDYVSFFRELNNGNGYNLRIITAGRESDTYFVLAESINQGALGVDTPIKCFFNPMSSQDDYLNSGGTM